MTDYINPEKLAHSGEVMPLPTASVKPEPVPLFEQQAHLPFPVADLPPVVRDAAEAVAWHVQAPPELAAMTVLAAAVTVAQGRINAPRAEGGGMPCGMYLLALAESGDRKSTCRRMAFKPIDAKEKAERINHGQAMKDWLADRAAQEPRHAKDWEQENPPPLDPRTQFSDCSFESVTSHFLAGGLVASWDTDEGGQMLGGHSMKGDNRAAILGGLAKLFDNGRVERDRAKSNLDGSGVAFDRAFSVSLLAQDVTVCAALADPILIGQGFLPRFLLAYCKSIAGTRFITPERELNKPEQDPRLQTWWALLEERQTHPRCAGPSGGIDAPVIDLSGDAKAVWSAFFNEMEREQERQGKLEGLRPFAGRAGEHARRLATVFAFINKHGQIKPDDMRSACAVVRYSVEQWAQYIEDVRPPKELEQAQRLLDWLKAKEWREFTGAKLVKDGPPVARNAKRRDVLLALLCDRHWLTIEGKAYKANW